MCRLAGSGETAVHWLQFPERLFFGLQIGLDVHVGGVQAAISTSD